MSFVIINAMSKEKYNLKIKLPHNVSDIISALNEAGFEAYAVGGCIRDSILGRDPNDWDITTSAKPHDIKKIFRRTVDTGIEHGTVTVLIGDDSYEVTTYRTDGEYLDARHPSSVEFVSSLTEDLRRRDFTINAMAYNEEEGLKDPFGGYEDLNAGRIRCVGNAFERLTEDALRILRAVRFSAQLSFDIDDETKTAIKSLAPRLGMISAERICTELIKLITSEHPEYIRIAYELGMTKVFLPEFDRMMETEQNSKYHIYSVGEHTIKTMQNIEADKILRLTMLLHDIGKPDAKKTDETGMNHFKGHAILGIDIAKNVMRRLKLDNDTIRKVLLLIRYHDWRFPAEIKNVRRAVNRLGEDMFPMFLKVQRADTLSKSEYKKEFALEHISKMEELFKVIIKEKQCTSLKELAVKGKDLINMGFAPGPVIGELLNDSLEEVIDDPAKNTVSYLTEFIKNKGENYERKRTV